MGCNFSTEPVKVIDPESSTNIEEEISSLTVPSDSNKRSSLAKSHDSFISNGSTDSERGTEILSPHRSKSIDLSRNGSANRDGAPVATATIIRGPSARSNRLEVPLPNQVEELTSPSHTSQIQASPQIEHRDKKKNKNQRRSSEGDVGKVTSVTCIPRSLVKSNPLLNSADFQEMKMKPSSLFGARNRLTLTQSQKDFFQMLDEKVAQGKDYCSEDERSLTSFHSAINRKGSNESNGIVMATIPQHVR